MSRVAKTHAGGLAWPPGLRALCSGFGPLSRVDVLPMVDAGKRKAVCLLRLNSSEQEQNLMTQLGAVRLGEDPCVAVAPRSSG